MNLITIDMDALSRAIYSNTDASEQEARSIINTVGFAAPAPASEAAYRVFKDGDQWCATGPGFIDIQQSTVAFADTAYRALELLTEAEGDEKRKGMRAVWGAGDSADAPVQQAETANTERLAFLQQHRVALIPEYEGPWDAEVYGESEAPIARGSGNTPHAAIDDVRAALKGEQPAK